MNFEFCFHSFAIINTLQSYPQDRFVCEYELNLYRGNKAYHMYRFVLNNDNNACNDNVKMTMIIPSLTFLAN